MYSKVSYCTILIGAQHKFCKTKGSNSKVCSVQTPYKALLCKACKRLTKQSFVWREVLPPPARSFAASGEKFCRLRREVLPPYKALLCKACKRLTKQSFVWRGVLHGVLPPSARNFWRHRKERRTK